MPRHPRLRSGAAQPDRPPSFHSLPIRILADDLTLLERPEIAAPDLDPLTLDRRPGHGPFGRAADPVGAQEVVVAGVVHVRDPREPLGQARPDRLATDEPRAPWIRSARALEDGIVREELHDCVEIVPVEAVQDCLERRSAYWIGHAVSSKRPGS